MLVTERFLLNPDAVEELYTSPINWGFGALSEATYYRTYSRTMDIPYCEANPWALPTGANEIWPDTVRRVVNGVLSIRKDWYIRNGIPWDETYWQSVAQRMARAIFRFHFLPPGRGLWAMGTMKVYEIGSAALNNCGFVDVQDLALDAGWAMDMLMLGVGVGFSTNKWNQTLYSPVADGVPAYTIPDSREGWVESLEMLIRSYLYPGQSIIRFDYSAIRPMGSPIHGFGGTASGPAPLQELHERARAILDTAITQDTPPARVVADIMNCIGCCVVAGNVRRSAELATGSVYDETFLNLKNYDLNPDRAAIGWMSNNSVLLEHSDDFLQLPMIAERIRDNGEPGVLNMMSTRKYGRFGDTTMDADEAVGFNPCAEIGLEDKELCNLAEVFPSRTTSIGQLLNANSLATIYASTVSLLPTHRPESNAVIARNRRIGVSKSGVADWLDGTHLSTVVRSMRTGYRQVRTVNEKLAREAGVPASIRTTTIKPSGTVSLLAGVSPGMHWPIFRYGIRRMRVSMNSPVAERLAAAGIPFEPDVYSSGTYVFEFPLESGVGKTRSVSEVSIWEQATALATWQREWADNAVSNTLTFNPSTESKEIERILAMFAPVIKSMSLLPNQDEQQSYEQVPNERTSRDVFRRRQAAIRPIDWSGFRGSDGQDSKFCETDACEIPS